MKWTKFIKSMFIVSAGIVLFLGWRAIARPPELPPRNFTEPQKRMNQKFGPLAGYELRVDAMKGEAFEGVTFHEVGVEWPFYVKGTQNLNNETEMGMSGPLPERVRITWRKSAQVGLPPHHDELVDEIVGQETIEVGSRIPQSVIDDLMRHPNRQLRLKFRMSNQGTLFGWDVEQRPGYKPNTNFWYPPAYTNTGGDFKEFRVGHFIETSKGIERLPDEDYWENNPLTPELIAKGYMLRGAPKKKLVESGWYIDKKTGKKIETDF